MKVYLLVFSSLYLTFFMVAQAVAQGWRGITPLRSSREDVRRLFGHPTDPGKKASAVYDLKEEIILVFFTSGPPCSPDNEWRVPEGTVVEITVTPKVTQSLSELHFDESKLKKITDPRNPDAVKYVDAEAGRSINVKHGNVEFITYSPSVKERPLRCDGFGEESNAPSSLQELHAVDFYGDIPFDAEKPRLDNFAIHLQEQPETNGHIVIHAGNQTRTDEVLMRAERAKKYLTRTRGIEAKRIIITEGEHHEKLTVELYLVPPGATLPVSMPTVDPSEVQIVKAADARKNNRRAPRSRCKK